MQKKSNLWVLITSIFMLGSFILLMVTFFDNDGWFILNNGRYISEHGIPEKNPFTWLEGLDIVIQQWLWSVIVYKIYETAGKVGLVLLCVSLYLLVMLLYVKIGKLYRVSCSHSIPFCAIMLLFMYPFLNIRPTFVTIVLLLWQVYILEKYKKKGNVMDLLWLILISLLEINLHSAIWVFHFVFLLPYIVPEIPNYFIKFKKIKMKRIPILLVSVGMFFVGFLNPYKENGMKYLLYSYGDTLKKAGITELKPPTLTGSGLFVLFFLILAAIWVSSHYQNKFQSSLVYILCGTTILSFSHTRNVVYFYLGFLLFSIEILKYTKDAYINRKLNSVLIAAVSMLWVLCLSVSYNIIESTPNQKDSELRPIKAVEYLQKHNVSSEARLYTEFNSGGFIGWHGYKTFMDAKPELYFKKLNQKIDAFQDYNHIRKTADPNDYRCFIEKYKFEWMIVSNDESMRMYLDMCDIAEVKMNGNGYKLYQVKKRD